ncbi:hypothetical protein PUR50_26910, partial [Enterobacter hormaechei subsp. steigerwaltii]|nr:hypothetical protein [Enterobacter hormaechei subsp. steigerwaltii]
RMKAVSHFRTLDAAAALAAANKRVSNILAKSDEVLSDRVNASTLKEPEEIKLAMQVKIEVLLNDNTQHAKCGTTQRKRVFVAFRMLT